MKRLILSLSFILYYLFFSVSALSAASLPGWTKKASKAVFTLKTFDEQGTLLGSSTGFFVTTDGVALSSYAPFKGASRAVVIDANGKELPVACILGANETYDVARFRVAAVGRESSLSNSVKTQPLVVGHASQRDINLSQHDDTGTQVWLLPYRELKNLPTGTITKAETFNDRYTYYTLALTMPDNTVGAPLLNEAGEVIGLMQQPNQPTDVTTYAVSALFADSLRISGLSINDPVLRATKIKKALPDEIEQALLTLYVAGAQMDSTAYASLIGDFIEKFPQSQEGYIYRAQLAANGDNYSQADQDMNLALKTNDKPDEAHYSFSRMIYQKEIYRPQIAFEPWTLDKALTEAQEAYTLSPQPTYRYQQAITLYALKRYDEAYNIYAELFNSPLRSPDLFYEAAHCKQLTNDTTAQLALLDSCIAQFSKPYLKEAAPYLLACSQAKMEAGKSRDAVSLLNDYEQLMAAQVNDQFYYLRFQAEVAGRLFQQALNDITRAIEMNPASDLYYAEKASLQVRVGLYDDAIATATEAIRVASDHSDGYLFLGLAQCLKGQKAEGVKNLKKAKELGDPQADGLIEKYSK